MECTDAKAADGPSNCIDFTNYPKHKITTPEMFGSFQVVPLFWASWASAEINYATLRDPVTGVEALYAPLALRFQPSAEIRLPGVATKLEFTSIAGQKGGLTAYWINQKGESKKLLLGSTDKEFVITKKTVSDPNGFDKIAFQALEHSYLKMCAYR